LNAEGIAAQGEVPYGIVYEFELKDCHRGCQDCHLDKDFQNSSRNNNLSAASNDNNEENKVDKGSGKDKNNSENRQSQNYNSVEKNPSGNNSTGGLVIGGVVIFSSIFLATALVLKKRKK